MGDAFRKLASSSSSSSSRPAKPPSTELALAEKLRRSSFIQAARGPALRARPGEAEGEPRQKGKSPCPRTRHTTDRRPPFFAPSLLPLHSTALQMHVVATTRLLRVPHRLNLKRNGLRSAVRVFACAAGPETPGEASIWQSSGMDVPEPVVETRFPSGMTVEALRELGMDAPTIPATHAVRARHARPVTCSCFQLHTRADRQFIRATWQRATE